jgi:hypothetical protein
VALFIGVVYWWEQQLPRRIDEAATSGRIDDCLRFSDQLAALSWLPGHSPLRQGECRRVKALQLWRQEDWGEALKLQRQLVNSPTATAEDRQQLNRWEAELRQAAMGRFQAGDLDGALRALAPMGEDHQADGEAIGDGLKEIWNRNQLHLKRATGLVEQARWWEALDSLNRIDHPWWQGESVALRNQVREGLEALKGKGKEQEHDIHGSLPHTVPPEQLEQLVERRIASGMDDWQAFEEACRELGGRIVEAGPESACQR